MSAEKTRTVQKTTGSEKKEVNVDNKNVPLAGYGRDIAGAPRPPQNKGALA